MRRAYLFAMSVFTLTAAGCAGAPTQTSSEPDARGGAARAEAAEAPADSTRADASTESFERSMTLAEALTTPAAERRADRIADGAASRTLHVDLGARRQGNVRREWAGLALRNEGLTFEAMANDVRACWIEGDRAQPDPARPSQSGSVDPTDRLSTATNVETGAVMDFIARRVDITVLNTCLSELGYAGVVLSQPPHQTNGPFNPAPGARTRILADARAADAITAATPDAPLETAPASAPAPRAEVRMASNAGPAVIGPRTPIADAETGPVASPAPQPTRMAAMEPPRAAPAPAAPPAPEPEAESAPEMEPAPVRVASVEPVDMAAPATSAVPAPVSPANAATPSDAAPAAPELDDEAEAGGGSIPARAARAEPLTPQSAILAPEMADALIAPRQEAGEPAPAPAPVQVAQAETAETPTRAEIDPEPALAGGPAPAPVTPAPMSEADNLPTLDELLSTAPGRVVQGRQVEYIPLGD